MIDNKKLYIKAFPNASRGRFWQRKKFRCFSLDGKVFSIFCGKIKKNTFKKGYSTKNKVFSLFFIAKRFPLPVFYMFFKLYS